MANTQKDGFLPSDYTPSAKGDFMRLSEGNNNIRVLSKPLIGKLFWVSPEGVVRDKGMGKKGDKPFRVKYNQSLPKEVSEGQTKEFWALKVWDYKDKTVKILEITQASILRSLYEFVKDEKWGDLREYDINIKKEGSGMDTKYFVMPSPPTLLAPEIKEALEESRIDLTSLLSPIDTSDPFEGMDVKKEVKKESVKEDDEEEGLIETVDIDENIIEDSDLPF
jgi:hypothetical protein